MPFLRNGCLATGLLGLCLLSPAAAPVAGNGTAVILGTDPLFGKWVVIEGVPQASGVLFEASTVRVCGTADFRQYASQQKVLFEPTPGRGSRSVPYGLFDYRFDPTGVLTLKILGQPDLRCYLKYKQERSRGLGHGPEQTVPYLCVFHEPRGRRAFQLVRMGGEIGSMAPTDKHAGSQPVFVPFEDVLTGPWTILCGRPVGNGRLEFRLESPAPTRAARLTVEVDNSATLSSGPLTSRFCLRQYDPNHWAISTPEGSHEVGTLALESAASQVVGPNILLTRWEVGPRKMTAVLLAVGSRRTSLIPAVWFEGAEPFSITALLAASPPGGATPLPPP